MNVRILFAVVTSFLYFNLCQSPSSHAGFVYLTGAQLYAASAAGGLSTTVDNTYRHSTNSSDTASKLEIAGTVVPNLTPASVAISFQLLTNETSFTFKTIDASPPYNLSDSAYFVGLNLFFGSSPASFNPQFTDHPVPLAGHLTVETRLNTPADAFTIPDSTKFVQNYAFFGAPSNKPAANGSDVYTVSGMDVQVTSFNAIYTSGVGTSGSFTLKVVATPEPATLGMCGIACVGLVGLVRRRIRQRKQV